MGVGSQTLTGQLVATGTPLYTLVKIAFPLIGQKALASVQAKPRFGGVCNLKPYNGMVISQSLNLIALRYSFCDISNWYE